MHLKELLETIMEEKGNAFLGNDPLGIVREFSENRDREIAAFFCASLAYGRVSMIRKNLRDLFSRFSAAPFEFVCSFEGPRDRGLFQGFKHRFNSGEDMACLCLILRDLMREFGSLEQAFLSGDEQGDKTLATALSRFGRRALACDFTEVLGVSDLPKESYVRYIFPDPLNKSACKRLCMLLRWLVRADDGIDLGLWAEVDSSRLVMPLDTHTARISRQLGLSQRKSADWKMALEVTEALAQIDANDPVRFDFALAHLGISAGCTGSKSDVCKTCAIRSLCSLSR